jgi:hypothetical protein
MSAHTGFERPEDWIKAPRGSEGRKGKNGASRNNRQDHPSETGGENSSGDGDLRAELLRSSSVSALLVREFPAEVQLLGSLITHTTRMFLVGPTGTGKTHFGMAMAGGIASRLGLLGWRSDSPATVRVLWIDVEMALSELQKRFADLARRCGYSSEFPNLHYISWQEADGLLPGGKWAPLNTPDGQAYLLKLIELIAPDVVFFDNVQSLVTGDMREEVPWNETMPFVLALTARRIGQVWCDHTGHEQRRQYGSSRKAWPFDAVAILSPLGEAVTGELAFTLSFEPPGGKARRRTPENWREYRTQIIRLRDDLWICDTATGIGGMAGDSRFGKLGAPARLMFRTIENLLAEGVGEHVVPEPAAAAVVALRRQTVRDRNIRDGWFSEAEVESSTGGRVESSTCDVASRRGSTFDSTGGIVESKVASCPRVTHKGFDRENKALIALKDKGLVGFSRQWVWLP